MHFVFNKRCAITICSLKTETNKKNGLGCEILSVCVCACNLNGSTRFVHCMGTLINWLAATAALLQLQIQLQLQPAGCR